MPYYDENSIPDDPYRVAPPFCAPGEVEPPPRPTVCKLEAVERVKAVIEGEEKRAFGRDAACWYEMLFEEMCGMHEAVVLDFLIPSFSSSRRIYALLSEAIHQHAENWLARADSDELEREGFL